MASTTDSTTTNATTAKRSTSETGHAKNVANFQDLVYFVTGLGTAYNPSKNNLKLPQLNTLLTNANASLTDIIAKNVIYNNKVNERLAAFSNLHSLGTRLVNALEITDAASEKVKDAKGFNRKLQGKRAGSAIVNTDPNHPAPTTISASQQSYDQQIQHFAGLIATIQSETSYAPNETDLKMVALLAKQADLIAKNNAVALAYTTISYSRITRNTTLYGTDTGLMDTAAEVKKYIKTIFGATSPQFALVKGIAFKKA